MCPTYFRCFLEILLNHTLQGREGDEDKNKRGGKIVVREDPPDGSRGLDGKVEEEEGMMVERVESGRASHRDTGAGEYTIPPFSFFFVSMRETTIGWANEVLEICN